MTRMGVWDWPHPMASTTNRSMPNNEFSKLLTAYSDRMVNCHRGTAKLILDDAYGRLGLAPSHGIDDESIDAEQRVLEIVDSVFRSDGKLSQGHRQAHS